MGKGVEVKSKLKAAIRGSKASIIVISENYATSTWCLDELALILEEQKKDNNRIVMPIFYHVNPSHLRKLEESFGDAMHKHRMNIGAGSQGMMDVDRWESALKEVGNLSGTVVGNGSEHNFIQEIVREINLKLGPKASTNLPLLIGRNDLVREINSWLANGSSNAVDILTICGIAGIGKTTLAKYIYHSNFGLPFDGRSFLPDIGSSARQPNTMLELQKKFLRDIGIESQEICDVDTGTEMIQEVLEDKRLFLVLDDVNDVKHVNSLLGKGRFHPGTKVIITTNKKSLPQEIKKLRNRDNIQSNYNYELHLLEGLSEDASLELFCERAFESNCPDEGFEELSREVVAYCGGHPLALDVLGRYLSQLQLHVQRWKETLEKLKTEFNIKIWEALKVSFDLFDFESDKEVFKDVACFLVGEERYCVETILEASSGIQNLINYCLLTVDSPSNCLNMVQLIREIGREMVRRGLRDNPSDRSKLWCHKDCFNVLMIQGKGARDIKCFILDMNKLNQEDSSKVKLETAAVKKMRSLELLKLNSVRLNGSYKKFPRSLKWLCWHEFPLNSIPSKLKMEALVALDMSRSKLQQWKPPKELPALKILNLSCSSELKRTAHFSKLPKLERLILRGCTSLVVVDESIGDLSSVVFVDMSWCESLSNLPSLPSTIVELNVQQCKSLKKVTFKSDTPPELRLVKSQCDQLTEIQGFFIVDYVKEAEEEVVNSLGWHFRAEQNLVTGEYSCRGW